MREFLIELDILLFSKAIFQKFILIIKKNYPNCDIVLEETLNM